MIAYICKIYFTDEVPTILSDSVPHHTFACEILDSDSSRVAAHKREIFARRCDLMVKSLREIYSSVVIKKVRTQIIGLD